MKINIEIELEKIKTKHFDSEEEKNKKLEYLYTVSKVSENNESLLFEIGKSYFLLEKFDLATEFLLKLIKSDKFKANSLDLLNKAYKAQNKHYRALRLLNKYKSFINAYDKEVVSIYLNEQRYDLLIKNIYKYMNGEHPLKNDFYKYAMASISKCNIENDRRKVIKYSKNILNSINKNNNIKFYNSVLNELEIAQRKVKLKSYPRRMTVSLTNVCNLDCKMCGYKKDVPYSLSKAQIDDIKKILPYLESVEWNGGEVFLSEYFEDLLDTANINNVKQYITTNCLLINDSYAQKFVKYNVDLTISIDSTDKQLYEFIRCGANFDTLIKNINMINNYADKLNKNFYKSINSVLSKWNYKNENNFIDTIKFAKKYNFNCVRISSDQKETDLVLFHDILTTFNKQKNYLINLAKELEIKVDFIMPSIDESTCFNDICEKPKTEKTENLKRTECINENTKTNDMSCEKEVFNNVVEKKETQKSSECYDKNKISEFNSIDCSLPFKKILYSFRGIVRPECVCQDLACIGRESIYGLMPYKNIESYWNGEEIVEYRKQIYNNNLHCLKSCLLSKEKRSYV